MTAEDLMNRAQARVDYLEVEGDICVEGLNPHDIVDSAGSWDCLDTVQWLFDQGVIPCDVDGVVTQDGFICFRSDLFTAH